MIKGDAKNCSIITVSSTTCVSTFHTLSAYACSKAGIECFTRCVADEMAKYGIRCNCMRPGLFDTPMLSAISKEEYEMVVGRTPLGRVGLPEDIAQLALFLALPKSSFITGISIPICGGLVM